MFRVHAPMYRLYQALLFIVDLALAPTNSQRAYAGSYTGSNERFILVWARRASPFAIRAAAGASQLVIECRALIFPEILRHVVS